MDFRVLFVCSGNTCRSPLAEAIARHLMTEAGEDGVVFESAGTAAQDGTFASRGSLGVAREHDLDLESFQSRRLTPEILDTADLVLVMELGHRSGVLGTSPTADTRTHLLGELAGREGADAAVPDPFGGSLDSYRRTYARLESMIRDALPRILQMAGERTGE
ncbi:MAG: low molecular weight protein arginine phosphatase [bacterium]|nr:low molecular weight protein arginine phosphatase [Gemmatimonadota bacterium]